MSGRIPSRSAICGSSVPPSFAAIALIVLATAGFALAQVHGVPPSVTSIQFHVSPFLPNIMPSVTSLGPYGYGYRTGPIPPPYGIYPSRPAYGRGRRSAFGSYGYGGSYAVPYYVPVYDSRPDMTRVPAGHICTPVCPPSGRSILSSICPSKYAAHPDVDDERFARAVPPPGELLAADAAPVEPTVLVFRDGHQQQVNNYAIMGQTVYVFDSRTQKISLSDLDVPATIKLNDDRGVEFQLPNEPSKADLNPQNSGEPPASTDVMLQTRKTSFSPPFGFDPLRTMQDTDR